MGKTCRGMPLEGPVLHFPSMKRRKFLEWPRPPLLLFNPCARLCVSSRVGPPSLSRLTLAAYEAMGILDLVATNTSDYARIGAWLVNDHAARESMRARILASNQVLFDDASVIPAWEAVLMEAVRRRAAALEAMGSLATQAPGEGLPQGQQFVE